MYTHTLTSLNTHSDQDTQPLHHTHTHTSEPKKKIAAVTHSRLTRRAFNPTLMRTRERRKEREREGEREREIGKERKGEGVREEG